MACLVMQGGDLYNRGYRDSQYSGQLQFCPADVSPQISGALSTVFPTGKRSRLAHQTGFCYFYFHNTMDILILDYPSYQRVNVK